MLYFNHAISKNLKEIGCKNSSGNFWRIVDKSNERPYYELRDSGEIPAFSIDDIILNEENAKNIWGIREEAWMLKVLQIFNLARLAEDKEKTINNFMANEYGYESETQMISPEKFKNSPVNYDTLEGFTMVLKRKLGSLATRASQKEGQPEDANRFLVKFINYPKKQENPPSDIPKE
ncbi:MAG: hypothetical protein Q8N22_01420 [bacterium]|nr:hypothetical protein [bacterium]